MWRGGKPIYIRHEAQTFVLVPNPLATNRNRIATAFIIEELDDGRYTVFVPSIPTPFTDAVRIVSRWGSGAKDLVAAMENGGKPVERGG